VLAACQNDGSKNWAVVRDIAVATMTRKQRSTPR
jgi:hypothetical protein